MGEDLTDTLTVCYEEMSTEIIAWTAFCCFYIDYRYN